MGAIGRLRFRSERGDGGVLRVHAYRGTTRVGTAWILSDTLGFIETKPAYRRMGVGLALLRHSDKYKVMHATVGSEEGDRLLAADGWRKTGPHRYQRNPQRRGHRRRRHR